MEQKTAKLVTKAIISTNHPLLDFRSKEAEKQVNWIYRYLKSYIFKDCKLVDLGCGTGKQSFAAEEIGAKVIGIDCSKEAIKFANRVKKEINSSCCFTIGDYTDIPFRNNAFDIVVFPKNIIECSYCEIEKICSGVKRILKKNGKFIITMEDGLKSILDGKKDNFKNYYIKTGENRGKITIPDKKQYSYPTYFWTIPFAKYIISNYFKFLEEKRIKNSCYYILVFVKNK